MPVPALAFAFLLLLQTADPAGLLQQGRFEEALKATDEQLKTHPSNARLLTIKGIALGQLGKETEAMNAYRSALVAKPDYLPALEGAAQIEYKNNDQADAAREHLTSLIKINPQDQTAHAMRGVLEARDGQCEDAAADFSAAPRAIEKQPPALHLFGSCLFRLHRWNDAQRVFEVLRALDASDRKAVYGSAASQIETGKFEAALRTLGKVDGDAQGLALSANALDALGRTPEAIEALRAAIVADPKRENSYTQFAELCFTYKSYQAGVDMMSAGLTQLPHSAKLYLARGVLKAQQGEYEAAEGDFQKASELDPKETGSADAQVLALIEANRFTDAVHLLNEKLKQHPQDARLFYFKADVLNREGDTSGSLAAARRAAALKPDYGLAHDLLAKLYAQNGEPEKAVAECKAALESDPDDETALYRWLRILKARHRDEDETAVADLTKRWNAAREKQRKEEVRASRFRIVTSQ